MVLRRARKRNTASAIQESFTWFCKLLCTRVSSTSSSEPKLSFSCEQKSPRCKKFNYWIYLTLCPIKSWSANNRLRRIDQSSPTGIEEWRNSLTKDRNKTVLTLIISFQLCLMPSKSTKKERWWRKSYSEKKAMNSAKSINLMKVKIKMATITI